MGSQFRVISGRNCLVPILVANAVITRPLTWVCSSVLIPPVSWLEIAVSRDDIIDRSKPLENYNTTDDHLTSVIAQSFTRWQHQHTQYIPQVAAPLPNRPNHHIFLTRDQIFGALSEKGSFLRIQNPS